MPMKLECMSLVCRMVKVFFPSAAAASSPGRTSVAPMAAAAGQELATGERFA